MTEQCPFVTYTNVSGEVSKLNVYSDRSPSALNKSFPIGRFAVSCNNCELQKTISVVGSSTDTTNAVPRVQAKVEAQIYVRANCPIEKGQK